MASHNQIIKVFSDIAGAHLLLRSFGNGDPLNIGNNVSYPLMWAVQQAGSVSIAGKNDTHSFVLIFADLVHADSSNEQEVLSDMRLVALDVLAQLQLPAYNDIFEVEPSARIEPFSHEIPNGNTADMVAGWTLNISLKTVYLSDHCAVPSTLDPTAEVTVCEPVSVYDYLGTLVAVVGSGGRYDMPAPDECDPATLKDSEGTVIEQVASGAEKVLADAVAKNSLNQTVDTKPYGQILSIGDSVIYKANGITTLTTIPAENNKTTAQIIALMSSAEVLADTNSANLTNGIVPLLSNANLANLGTSQRAYVVQNTAPTTYNFPIRTFATAIFRTGDAKWIHDNYFTGLPNGITPRLADYKNLATYNNIFGNAKRFTGVTGGYQDDTVTTTYRDVNGNVTTEALAFPSDYMIDHYTGLGWIRTSSSTGGWGPAIDAAVAFSVTINSVLYNNFFVPDKNQMESIRTHVTSLGLDPPFVITTATHWTSSTAPALTASAIGIGLNGSLTVPDKTLSARHLKCRKHF